MNDILKYVIEEKGPTIHDIINQSDLDQGVKDRITALVEVMRRRTPRA